VLASGDEPVKAKSDWAWGVLGLLLLACGEGPEQDATCSASCSGSVVLIGSPELPEATGLVDAAYCYPSGCVSGLLDLRQVSRDPVCAVADFHGEQASVCATRVGATELEVVGTITFGPSEEKPLASQVYSVRLTDHETGEELLNERGSPEYTPGETCGLTCWSAEITF
jgi:hypothetical protein